MRAINNFATIGISFLMVIISFYLAGIDVVSTASFSSFFLLLGITFGLGIAAFPFKDHLGFIEAIVSSKTIRPQESQKIGRYLRLMGRIGLISGFLGFTLSISVLLSNTDSLENVGAAFALGIKCLAYGYVFRFIFWSISERFVAVQDPLAVHSDEKRPESNKLTDDKAA